MVVVVTEGCCGGGGGVFCIFYFSGYCINDKMCWLFCLIWVLNENDHLL